MSSKTYIIDFAPRTEGQLNLIPKNTRKLVFERIERLTIDPRPEGVELVTSRHRDYR